MVNNTQVIECNGVISLFIRWPSMATTYDYIQPRVLLIADACHLLEVETTCSKRRIPVTCCEMILVQAAQTSFPTPSIQLPSWLTLASHSFNLVLMPSICFMSSTLGCTQLIRAISATWSI